MASQDKCFPTASVVGVASGTPKFSKRTPGMDLSAHHSGSGTRKLPGQESPICILWGREKYSFGGHIILLFETCV